MKRSFILALVSLTCFSALTSCQNNNNWSQEEQDLMKEHLNGFVVPYIVVENAEWSYDELNKSVVYKVSGDNISSDTLQSYCDSLMDNNFTEIPFSPDETISQSFKYKINENEYILADVFFFESKSEFIAGYTYFTGDTKFPADKLNEHLTSHGFEVNIPAIESDKECLFNIFDMVFIDIDSVTISVFTEDTELINKYATTLQNDGWTSKDSDKVISYTDFTNDNGYIITAPKTINQFGFFDIHIYKNPTPDNWTNEELNLMKEHMNGYTLPYIPLEGANWKWYEEYEVLSYEAFTGEFTTADVILYSEALTDFGWQDMTAYFDGMPGYNMFFIYLLSDHESSIVNFYIDDQGNFSADYSYLNLEE